MARDDYGAISVISDLEREALGLGGRKPDDEEEGLFETIGKAGDKLGETKLGKKLGSILTVLILAFFGGGGDLSVLGDFLEQEDDGKPKGGCTDPTAINYKHDADFDNGTCVFPPPVIYGCTNPDADNYNAQATHDNGRCQFLGGPVDNNTGNETNEDTTVYGCMDPEAENYNERAEEDDGTCEYEEYDCASNQTYFYGGLEYGNYSREPNTLNITVDVDTDCDLDTLPIMIGYDVGHIKVEDNETVWNGYMWNDFYYNVTGWEGDEFILKSGPEYFTEPYTGWYIIWVNLFADWERNGVYEYVTSFSIDELYLEVEE